VATCDRALRVTTADTSMRSHGQWVGLKPETMRLDQGHRSTSQDWQKFLREHNLVSSVSRRGNCHDKAIAESFYQLLKDERVANGSMSCAVTHAPTSSTTSRCSKTLSGATP
jgi:transposase InsO family protein